MVIKTSAGIQLYQISNIPEPMYIDGVPYSLQQKCNIPKNIIKYYKGKPYIYCNTREIDSPKAIKIIKIINGYAKANNQILFR